METQNIFWGLLAGVGMVAVAVGMLAVALAGAVWGAVALVTGAGFVTWATARIVD